MSSSGKGFHVSFRYNNEIYQLGKGENSDHTIKINGVTYTVLGKEGKLKDVCKILQSASLESVLSESDLLGR